MLFNAEVEIMCEKSSFYHIGSKKYLILIVLKNFNILAIHMS